MVKNSVYGWTVAIASTFVVIMVLVICIVVFATKSRILQIKNDVIPSEMVLETLQGRVDVRDGYLKEIRTYSHFKKDHSKIKPIIEHWEMTKKREKEFDKAKVKIDN